MTEFCYDITAGKSRDELADMYRKSVRTIGELIRVADAIEQLICERDIAQRKYEIKDAAANRWQPCPGHRGKVDTMKDGCPWCRAEIAEAENKRLRALADAYARQLGVNLDGSPRRETTTNMDETENQRRLARKKALVMRGNGE